ncbi:MAG: pitrilysin family protein, partial [Acidobacteria bacterium]|nr:pitrilysin family protein [Acidobacteriota bacterium]
GRPAPVRRALANGAAVIEQEAHTTPAVSLNLSIDAGSVCEPASAPGAAHFLARVLDRGTSRRSADEIAETCDGGGVTLAVHATRHTLSLGCTCLAEDFAAMVDLLADIVRDPRCPEAEVEKRRRQILTSIRQDDDSPAARALERLNRLLYGAGHPYGRRVKGTAASVEGIDRGALLDYHRDRIAPSALSVVVVGDVAAAAAGDAVAAAFDGWQAAPDPPPDLAPPPAAAGRRRDVVPMPGKAQVDLAYGFAAVARTDPAYHAHVLLANVLGQYGMGGRVGRSVRERQGMAYYAFAGFEADRIAGPLIVRAGINAANVDRALASIDEVVAEMGAEGVTEAELEDSRRYLVGSLPRTLETNAGTAAFLQNAERFGLGLDYDRRVPGLLGAVTRDEVNAAARALLAPERAAVAIAGPVALDGTDPAAADGGPAEAGGAGSADADAGTDGAGAADGARATRS